MMEVQKLGIVMYLKLFVKVLVILKLEPLIMLPLKYGVMIPMIVKVIYGVWVVLLMKC